MSQSQPADLLTEDMIEKINHAIKMVLASGYGEVTIVIEKGVPRWVRPAPSLPLSVSPPERDRT